MFEPLSDQDRARLHAKFVVPIVVDQMLRDEEPLDDVGEHAMNEILFELCPDTALLCLALCARHIARHAHNLPIAQIMEKECDKIIDEYGALWLAHERRPETLDSETIKAQLSLIPEDLESLRDLLETTLSELEEDHCVAAILCDILSLQADHHRDMAELELQHIQLDAKSRRDNENPAFSESAQNAAAYGDNVIAFPLATRNGPASIRS